MPIPPLAGTSARPNRPSWAGRTPEPAWQPNREDDSDFSDLLPPEEGEDEQGPGSSKTRQLAGLRRLEAILEGTPAPMAKTGTGRGAAYSPGEPQDGPQP